MAVRHVLLVAVVASALGGCAAASDGTPAGPPSVSAPALSVAPSLAATLAPNPSRPAAPPSGMSVSGEVVEGVETGCLLLKTTGPLYLLIGGDRAALVVGKRVTVVGSPQPGLMSTCQQGTPFQVVSVRGG